MLAATASEAEGQELELAKEIMSFVETNSSGIPDFGDFAVKYLADVADGKELQADLRDLSAWTISSSSHAGTISPS